jgi:hypothetical protein
MNFVLKNSASRLVARLTRCRTRCQGTTSVVPREPQMIGALAPEGWISLRPSSTGYFLHDRITRVIHCALSARRWPSPKQLLEPIRFSLAKRRTRAFGVPMILAAFVARAVPQAVTLGAWTIDHCKLLACHQGRCCHGSLTVQRPRFLRRRPCHSRPSCQKSSCRWRSAARLLLR